MNDILIIDTIKQVPRDAILKHILKNGGRKAQLQFDVPWNRATFAHMYDVLTSMVEAGEFLDDIEYGPICLTEDKNYITILVICNDVKDYVGGDY